MAFSESRFNSVAKALGYNISWSDTNKDGVVVDKIVDHISRTDHLASNFSVVGGKHHGVIDHLVVGNPKLFQELTDAIQSHGNSSDPIKTETAFESLQASAETIVIPGLKLNEDEYPDFLLVQSFETYVSPMDADKHETVAFLAAVYGTADSKKMESPTADMVKGADLKDIIRYPGKGYPLNRIDVLPDGVGYSAFDPIKQKYEKQSIAAAQKPSPQENFDALFSVSKYFSNSFGYLVTVMGSQLSKGGKAEEYVETVKTALYNKASFAFTTLSDQYAALKEKNAGDTVDGIYLPFAMVLVEEARKTLILSEEDKIKEAALKSKSQEVLHTAVGKFTWNGKQMGRQDYYKALEEVSSPKDREDIAKTFAAMAIAAHSSENGLFSTIDVLNKMAVKYGYKNYPDMVVKVQNLSDLESFDRMMAAWAVKYGKELEVFIAQLEALNGGKPVNEWDVPYLTNLLIEKEIGKIPTLPAEDGFRIAKRYYKDLGADLDSPPYAGNIFYDTKKRDDKYQNAFAESIGCGNKAWFNANFDPKEPITLKALSVVIHEMGHLIQFITGAETGGGSQMMNSVYAQPFSFAEGFAISLEDSVFSKQFMDKYLAGIPQFSDPKVRETIVKIKRSQKLWQTMQIMVRARQEMELYFPGKLEQKFEAMAQIAEKNLYVNAEPDKLDFWSVTHIAGVNLYYSNYSLGRGTVEVVNADVFDALAGNRPFEGTIKTALDVFRAGAKLRTLKDIEDFVKPRRSRP